MSKLVINTQYRENYGTATNPYWKFKGGDTYVVEALSYASINKIAEHGIPHLTALIESFTSGSEEYILNWEIVEDGVVVGEAWDTITKLEYRDGQWIASRVIENDEYGWMRQEIARKFESWVMEPKGGRKDYKAEFVLRADGRHVDADTLAALFA